MSQSWDIAVLPLGPETDQTNYTNRKNLRYSPTHFAKLEIRDRNNPSHARIRKPPRRWLFLSRLTHLTDSLSHFDTLI
jgi:hypothetical protein